MSLKVYATLSDSKSKKNNLINIYYDGNYNSKNNVIGFWNEDMPSAWLENSNDGVNSENNKERKAQIVKIDSSLKNWKPETLLSFFDGLHDVVTIEGLENIDSSNCVNFAFLFSGCKNLRFVDLSSWDTSSAFTMNYMFANCWGLQKVNLSNWDVRSCCGTANMFENCKSLRKLDISSWHFSRKKVNRAIVTDGDSYKPSTFKFKFFDSSDMFSGCHNLSELHLSKIEAEAFYNLGKSCEKNTVDSCVIFVNDKPKKVSNNKLLFCFGSPLPSSQKYLNYLLSNEQQNSVQNLNTVKNLDEVDR